ncbi:amidohydrolase family protein [Undibacterium fentianense]|uniref:Amidohydrolase family protein n=1 Tax=Undibacterium fentianense TaxID=2828728 RepID=A0A941E372_9BURK|nr:amidohydrolase family protein [Undibacterium fentianense]MBR7800646.1 amidohydrolase family protein [Undibacterium fentianense]
MLQIRHLMIHSTLVLTLSLCGGSVNAEQILIQQARLIQGDSPTASMPMDVLLEKGKIVAIASNLSRKTRMGVRLIDGKGQFLIPGLVDSHVHLEGIPGYMGKRAEDQMMLEQAFQQMPRSYAYFGFTTVQDLTGDPRFIAEWNSAPAGPQAHYCSPVTIPNGYPASWMDKELQFQVPGTKYMLFDPAQAQVYPTHFHPEAHTPEAVVRAAKQDGARCIKVFYETGFGPKKDLPVPSVELIQAVVKHAKLLKLPVYLHGNSQAAYEFALKTGVTTLVHGLWHETKLANQIANQTRLQEIAEEIARAGIAVQPTIQVLYGEQEMTNPNFFQHPELANVMPAELLDWYQTPAGQKMAQLIAADFDPANQTPASLYKTVQSRYQPALTIVKKMTAALNRQGAKIVFGSDTPSGPFYTQFPGVNGRWEMDRWLEAGMSLSQLFKALTIENARAMDLEDTIGSIAVGKQADLLLLRANPLETLAAYDQISYVILRGKAHQRESLSAKSIGKSNH